MLKLAGELIEGQLADHIANLDAHTYNMMEQMLVGDYFVGVPCFYSTTRTVQSANRLYANPCIITRPLTVDRIGMYVQTAASAGKKARLGIHKDNGSVYPGELVVDAGEIAIDSTGLKAITISESLTRGIHWLIFNCDEAFGIITQRIVWTPLGYGTSPYAHRKSYYSKDVAYAAFADPFPAGATQNDYYYGEIYPVRLRLASLD